MYRYQHYQRNSQETSNNAPHHLCYSFEILCSTPDLKIHHGTPSNNDVLKALTLATRICYIQEKLRVCQPGLYECAVGDLQVMSCAGRALY